MNHFSVKVSVTVSVKLSAMGGRSGSIIFWLLSWQRVLKISAHFVQFSKIVTPFIPKCLAINTKISILHFKIASNSQWSFTEPGTPYFRCASVLTVYHETPESSYSRKWNMHLYKFVIIYKLQFSCNFTSTIDILIHEELVQAIRGSNLTLVLIVTL